MPTGSRSSFSASGGDGDWWASFFDALYLREYDPLFSVERDRAEVSRLLEVLGLHVGARVLDAACGQGRHSHLLAEAGLDVDGLDYSEPLLAIARARGTGRTLRFSHGDMRSLPREWTGRFDAIVNLSTSFGFFRDPADDVAVLAEFARVLTPGGVLAWHGASRDGVVARFLARDWWTIADGVTVAQERRFDPLSGVLHVESRWSGAGRSRSRSHRLRLYTATRLSELCGSLGLIVEEAWDGWHDRPLRRTSSEMLLVARKRDGDTASRLRQLPRPRRRG